MALSHISRSVRLKTMIFEARRMSGTLCKICCPTTLHYNLLEPKRSRTLSKESVSMAILPYCATETAVTQFLADPNPEAVDLMETNLISVMNLVTLLENLPPVEKDSTLPDSIQKARNSFGKQGYDSNAGICCDELSKPNKRIMDGQYLDKMFGLDKEEKFHDPEITSRTNGNVISLDYLSSIFATPKYEAPDFSTVEEDYSSGTSYSFLEPDSLQKSFENYVHLSRFSENVLLCKSGGVSENPKQKQPDLDKKLPNLDELNLIQNHLNDYLPRCFAQKHDYRIYSEKVIFENNFAEKSFTTQGIGPYVREMSKYRIYAHMRYANVKMHVLKSTVHENEGTVKIRWRISGIPQVRAFMFWKFLPWKYSKAMDNESEWMDGLSTFYVEGGTGVVTRHRVDKVIVDKEVSKNVIKNPAINMSGTV